ncbi:MAG: Cytochrome c heme lyase subunit CcmF, partial [Myxococcaceae bacterium]|nr:Cytochrome c heme lyase subunit CcmF [Myxococcaceae bacterium]
LSGYELRYDSAHTEVDPNKSMLFTELTVLRAGEVIGHVSPAKFRYRTHPEMPTTEVAIRSTLRDDIYVIMSQVNPETKLGVFRVIVRPLVAWIWIGGLMLLFGAFVAISPSVAELLESVKGPLPRRSNLLARPAMATFLVLGVLTALLLIGSVASAQAVTDSSSLMAGTVAMKSPEERKLFERVLCQCGDCARLPLSTCVCGWAEGKRAELRVDLAAGKSVTEIQTDYAERYGAKAIAIPRDKGLDRALWAVPIAGFVLAAGGITLLGRRWVQKSANQPAPAVVPPSEADSELDRVLDEELRKRG